MLFVSYQPFTKKEGQDPHKIDNFNDGSMRTERILERDQAKIDALGYNPYWAIGGDNMQDILIQSLFCAPNNSVIAFLFKTDDYIRIDKKKWYQHLDENPLDFRDDNLDNLHSEFLVKELNQSNIGMIMLPYITSGYPDIKDILSSTVFNKLQIPKDIIDEWNYLIYYISSRIHFTPGEIPDYMSEYGYTQEGYEATMLMLRNRRIFEIAILPVLLTLLTTRDKNGNANFSTTLFYPLAYTSSAWLDLGDQFGIWGNSGATDIDKYETYIEQAKKLFLPEPVIRAFLEGKKYYPNDLCPCGCGKKWKKCHGNVIDRNIMI